jgi:formylglycine-generating enzyme required for sulfatase activity
MSAVLKKYKMADQDNSNLAIEATPFARADTNGQKKKLALKPIPIALGIVFLALAVSAMFMFTAKAVRFNISPTPESFTISKGFFSYQLGERYLMLSGDYEITAQLTGYKVFQQVVTIGNEADQGFKFQMSKLPGILSLNTEPPIEAEVFIDQVSVGISPIVIEEIEPGLHDISIQSERYLPYETEILIEGMRLEQAINAVLEPAWAEVTFVTLPPEAEVSVDEISRGSTPVTIEILEGARQLKIKKPGYKIWQSELNIIHGQPVQLPDITLIKSDGKVTIKTNPPGVNITIGNRYRGQSPLSVTLAPGESYDVLLSKAGYELITRAIQVDPEQDVSLNVTLKPVVGVIRLQVHPPGGELFLDGQPAGEPSQQLTMTASRHIIEIRKDGYATYKTMVTPQPGLSQQLLITLQTDDEARAAAIPQQITTGNGDELKLILPGELKMGAGRRERGRRSNEIEKDVVLTKPYYLGVREVTNKQFKAFKPGHDSGVFGRALLTENDRPVVNISWYSAAQYCNWLSEQEGLPVAYEQVGGKWKLISPSTTGFRMPSEAEWAWAARYATDSSPHRFPWGDSMPPLDGAGNFADEAAAGMVPYHIVGYKDAFRGPAPVGSYASNELGIHDLAGNVSEWISDYYSVELEREQLTDPQGPEHGDYYVIRGSNYTNGRFSELRWTFRDYGAEPRRDVGFRIARYLESDDKE